MGASMEKEYYDAQIRYINEIRSIRHDIQAHMIVLQYYLESENYEKAKCYLKEMKNHQRLQGLNVKDTGNDLVNAILGDSLNRSTRKIAFEITGLLPEKMPMNEYDICTLFSNLFSNAREACEKLKVESPWIGMEVKVEESEYVIVVQNPIEWKIRMDEKGLISSKKD